MIDQTVAFSVLAGAPPQNISPTNFNPVPADGFVEVWGCLDELTSGNLPAQVSVTLGGATPYTPVPLTALRVNSQGINGAGPEAGDVVMGRQGVRQGTNLQVNLQGGVGQTCAGRIRFRFMSLDEVSTQAGAVAA